MKLFQQEALSSYGVFCIAVFLILRSFCSFRHTSSQKLYVTVHGFPVPSSPCLVCVRVRMCEQVSVGCVWLRLIRSSWESSPLGYICSCHALSFVRSLQCLQSTFTVRSGSWFRDSWALLSWTRFMSPAASWTPIAGPWLPIASLRYPPLPYRKLRLCPTESSASAYGKLRFCLRKAPPLPTESSAIHFVFWLFLSINLSSCNWILQALVCDRRIWPPSWIQRRLVVCRNC